MTAGAAHRETEAQGAVVEEMMINKAQSGPARFERLERISERFVVGLGPVMSEFAGMALESEFGQIEYEAISAARARANSHGISLLADAPEWTGPILLWIETPLLVSIIDALMGSKAGSDDAGSRAFTRLEKHIVRQIGAKILDGFSRAYSDVRHITFDVREVPDDLEETGPWQEDGESFTLRGKLSHSESAREFLLILPFGVFKRDHEELAKQHEAHNSIPTGGWRKEISHALAHTGVELVAVLKDDTVALAEALKWKAGDTLNFEIDPAGPLRVTCDERPFFRAVAGRRENGLVALRVTSDIELERTAPYVTSD